MNRRLENFQWRSSEEAIANLKQNMKEEMADILIYLVKLADKMEVDLEEEGFKHLEEMQLNILSSVIHTCQGLKFDYVGVIIGEDLR